MLCSRGKHEETTKQPAKETEQTELTQRAEPSCVTASKTSLEKHAGYCCLASYCYNYGFINQY